jgi:nicotinate-nucleotide adenylyltransferase
VARIGLLGGTFNPPHLAHLVCAQEALVQLGLDRVLLVPAAEPPHKAVEADPGVAHRVAMCEAAVAGDDRLGVSRADAERSGPAYTVELLRALRAEAPGDEYSFIVGGDMAYSLPTWHDPEGVLSLARLAVAERDGVRRADIAERLAALDGARERIDFFDMPRIDISSSLLRRRAASGGPLRYLVPEAVAEYIAREGLYTGRQPAPPAARLSLGGNA